MALYPYSKVKTERLGLLLFAARAVTLIGLLWFVITIMIGVVVFAVGGSQPFQGFQGGYMMLASGMGATSLMVVLWGFGVFVAAALAGGIGAGVVAIESHLSRMADKNSNAVTAEDQAEQ